MYGTVARMRLKPGALAEMDRLSRNWSKAIPGFVFQHVYQMDSDPNEVYLTVAFVSKAAYVANANSPEQAARFSEYMALMERPPEWHDGEIVMSYPS